VIPRAADEYLANRNKGQEQEGAALQANPAWFIRGGKLPEAAGDTASPVSFGMLLNLASVANAESPDVLWGFLRRYEAGATPEKAPYLARLVEHAVAYYQDFVRPAKTYRAPDMREREALSDLAETLKGVEPGAEADALQNLVFEVGKRHGFPELRAWFGCLYEVLLGQKEGPRFGIFIALYGVAETVALIEAALARAPAEPTEGLAGEAI